MMSDEWLERLKEGDKVIVWRGSGRMTATTVKRLTPTQIIVHAGAGETRFRKRDGEEVGAAGYWRGALIEWSQEWQDERDEEERRRRLLAAFREYRLADVPTDAIERALAILDATRAAASEGYAALVERLERGGSA